MNFIKIFVKPTSIGIFAIGFFLFRIFFAHLDVDPQAVNVLKRWVSAEYTRYQMSREDISLQEKAELLASAENLEFLSVAVRGKPERTVFRVELTPNPAQPPNTPNVRYFRMEHSLVLGWNASIPKRSDAVVYFLALFML